MKDRTPADSVRDSDIGTFGLAEAGMVAPVAEAVPGVALVPWDLYNSGVGCEPSPDYRYLRTDPNVGSPHSPQLGCFGRPL